MNVSKWGSVFGGAVSALFVAFLAQGCSGNVSTCEDGVAECNTTSGSTSSSPSTTVPESAIEALCEKACSCGPDACGTGGLKQCILNFQDLNEQAQATGCEGALGIAFSCYEDNLVCENGSANAEVCADDIDAFNKCLEGPPPEPGSCAKLFNAIYAKYESCGIDVGPSNPGECTAEILTQLKCVTPCIAEAPCTVFGDNPPPADLEAYAACLDTCS